MGEDGNDKRKVEPFLNEISHHKVMETASLSFKQQSPLGTNVLSGETNNISGNLCTVTSAFVYITGSTFFSWTVISHDTS